MIRSRPCVTRSRWPSAGCSLEGQKAAAPGLLDAAQQGEPSHRLHAIQTLQRMGEREREIWS